MEVNDSPPAEYLKGFNKGYTIAEHLPDLAEQLKVVQGNIEQLAGLRAGIEQYGIEKNKTQNKDSRPAWLQPNRLTSLDKDDNKTKDKETPNKE